VILIIEKPFLLELKILKEIFQYIEPME
jgi:hypothetical protein